MSISSTAAARTSIQRVMFGGQGIEQYKLIRFLGSGSFGRVFLVKKNCGHDMNKFYALKVVPKIEFTECDEDSIRGTVIERKILEIAESSPFIVKMHYAFQDERALYVVLDVLPGGMLNQHLINGMLPEDITRFYAGEMVLALEYLHEQNVIYRDIKAENILLNAEGHAVLIDFGLSNILDSALAKVFSTCGTVEFMAPEMYHKTGYTKAVDWWAMGVLICELLTGICPFTELTNMSERTEILDYLMQFETHTLPTTLSENAQSLLAGMLCVDVNKRFDVTAIKNHQFFRGLSWRQLSKQSIEPPIKPIISPEHWQTVNSEFDQSLGLPKNIGKTPTCRGFNFIAQVHRPQATARTSSSLGSSYTME